MPVRSLAARSTAFQSTKSAYFPAADRTILVTPRAGPPRAAGPPPTQGFGSPPREPNYPAPGYRDYGERRSGDYDERRGRCEQIRERRRELRDRLEYASWEDRGRLEYRLRELGEERERLGCLR